jgi:DNA polymerase-3 subunit chi
MEVTVYQLHTQTFGKAFPRLVETIVSKGMRCIIYCYNLESLKQCDNLLWSYDQLSFLPHQTKGDKSLVEQSIYLTDQVTDNPYGATVLVFYNSTGELPITKRYSRTIHMLSPEEVTSAESLMIHYKRQGLACNLLIQQSTGSWKAA